MFKCRLKTNLFSRNILRNLRYYSEKSSNTRNIGIIAHIDAGKTTTTERMLYYSGLTNHIGNVDEGDTVMDYLPAERNRGITINSAAITFNWNDHRINLIDTPGHADFTFEVIRSLRVLDGAVTILDAVAGVEAQTEKVWKQADSIDVPRLIFVNKMDREGAGFGRTIREVVAKLETITAIINIPYFETKSSETRFLGVIDVLDKKLIKWAVNSDGKEVEVVQYDDLDVKLQKEIAQARTALIETATDTDSQFEEEFLESDGDCVKYPSEPIKQAIRRATIKGVIVPVLCGASFRNIGVQPLLEAIVDYLPDPKSLPFQRATTTVPGESRSTDISLEQEKDISCSLAFKVANDPIRGLLVYIRVYSGSLRKGTVIYNTSNGKKERVTSLALMQADRMVDTEKVEEGNIAVIVGSKNIRTGDTLVSHRSRKDGISVMKPRHLNVKLNAIDVPPTVFFATIEPISKGDEQSMENALDILLKEDPSLKRSFDQENQQILLEGMGELHLEIASERLKQLKARVNMGRIRVSYSETITTKTQETTVESSYTKHSADLSNAKVCLNVQPRPLESSNHLIEFDNDNCASYCGPPISHPILEPEDFFKALEIGAKPVFARGGKIANLPLRKICIEVSCMELADDSTTAEAISVAVRKAAEEVLSQIEKVDYAIMEPIMSVSIVADEEDVGNVVNDVSGKRRGFIRSLGHKAESAEKLNKHKDRDYQKLSEKVYVPKDYTMYLSKHADRTTTQQTIVTADIPLKSMIGYLTGLRSLTQGRGTFVMSFDRYEVIPKDMIEEIRNEM